MTLGTVAGAWQVLFCKLAYLRAEPGNELQFVFVYCEPIAPQFVSNTLARCLRTVHYPSVEGHHVFDNVYYVFVEKTDFQRVSPELLTNRGGRSPFPYIVKPQLAVPNFRQHSYRV
jgi:hypothetical protein